MIDSLVWEPVKKDWVSSFNLTEIGVSHNGMI